MKYVADTHTHTIASGHAYTTWLENVKEASIKGIQVLGTTDHGPAMPGASHAMHFCNFRVLPRELFGVTLLHGCEANIIDFEGNIDMPERLLKSMDLVIVSLHEVVMKPGNIDENTNTLLKVMDNPYTDIIGHPGNPAFPLYEEEIVKKAKEKNILIEINNSSLSNVGARAGSKVNCTSIAALCKKYGVKVALGTDAHVCFDIGNFERAEKLLEEVHMPEELIINTDRSKVVDFLKSKGKLKDFKLD